MIDFIFRSGETFIRPKSKADSSMVSIATLDQGLEEDFQYLGTEDDTEQQWTCKKCTLLNVGNVNACVVCGGSKLRALTITHDYTLRRGEFWSCSKCTLKNPLSSSSCKVCKTKKHLETPNHPTRSPSPRHLGAYKRHSNNLEYRHREPREPPISNRTRHSADADEWPLPTDDSPWQCTLCTYENLGTNNQCEMCGSVRKSQPVFTAALRESADARTHSEPMENLRITEEELALRKWEHIVRYCKQVSLINPFYIFQLLKTFLQWDSFFYKINK